MMGIRVPYQGRKKRFDLPLAQTNKIRSFRPCRDLDSFCDREPSVETLGYFQDKKALTRYRFGNCLSAR